MPDPKTNSEIMRQQKKANDDWTKLQKSFEAKREDHTKKALSAQSKPTKEAEERKADEMKACAEYCRSRLG